MKQLLVTPPSLKPQQPVIFVATARRIAAEDIAEGIQFFQQKGHAVLLAPGIFEVSGRFAGSDDLRLQSLQWALDHPHAGAIICCRGGYGTSRLLDKIDYTRFLQSPKWLAGFSDVTAIIMDMQKKGICSIHSTMPLVFDMQGANSTESLYASLTCQPLKITAPHHLLNRHGQAEAPVIGGNLSLLAHLAGTSSMPSAEGYILFIEDLDEYLYHADRMLLQLDRAGVLAGLAGLAVGSFTGMQDHENEPYGASVEEIILERVSKYNFPVAFNLPIGHGSINLAVVCGRKYTLTVNSTQTMMAPSDASLL